MCVEYVSCPLNPSRSQGYTYDSLNRIGSFSLGGTLKEQYSTDSFGNMTQMAGGNPVNTFDTATNRVNLSCGSVPFDAAGNQRCSTNALGAITQYVYDADSRIASINALNGGASTTYTYGGDGARVLKSNADGSYTEYVAFNGQTIAELSHTPGQPDGWTDYVFANGKKIARVAPTFSQLHIHGVRNNTINMGCGTVFTETGMGGAGYVIRSGDRLVLDQKSVVASGGVGVIFSDGTPKTLSLVDQNGYTDYDGPPTVGWQHRVVDLSSIAGKTIGSFVVTMQNETPAGTWDEYFSDLELLSSDGTVLQIFNGQSLGYGTWSYCGTASPSFAVEQVAPASDSTAKSTYFYLGDHLGTAQMEFAAGGWPVWQGQFSPYGQELDTQTTANNYKFTGKERDAESGLDYFDARYYGSSMGSWMSPDWSSNPISIPFASLTDPQTLNLYSYVGNNPLSRFDPYGHSKDCEGGGDPSLVCIATTIYDKVKNLFHSDNSHVDADNGVMHFTPQQEAAMPRNISLNVGGSAELGVQAGYAITGQAAAVWDFKANHVYGTKTAGGTASAGVGGEQHQSPDPKAAVYSLYAGGGVSVSIGNGTEDQMRGDAHTLNLGGRGAPFGIGFSYSYTGTPWKPGVYSVTIAPPFVNWGAGGYFSHYDTHTEVVDPK